MHHGMATTLNITNKPFIYSLKSQVRSKSNHITVEKYKSDPTYGHVDYSLSEPVADISIFSQSTDTDSDAIRPGTILYFSPG